jgi:hypothetical protein
LTSTNQQEVGNCWAQSLFYVLKRYLTELEQYANIVDNTFKFHMRHNNLNIFLSSKFLNTASIIGKLTSNGVIRGYIDKNIAQLKIDIETEINNYITRTGDTINQGDIDIIVIIFTNVVVYYMFCVFAFDTINVTNQSMLANLSFSIESKRLNPKYLTMIVPSRWFAGGRGLDDFRNDMLKDKKIKKIHDFLNASDCFPGVEIKGGVCYFLWDREFSGDCEVNTYENNTLVSSFKRPLLENGTEVFIRYNEAIPILRKIKTTDFSEPS